MRDIIENSNTAVSLMFAIVTLIAMFVTGLAFWATVFTAAAYLLALIFGSVHVTTILTLGFSCLKVFLGALLTVVVSGLGAIVTRG